MRVVAFIFAFISIVATAWAEAPGPQMTVSGEGRVISVPDMATVRLGVISEAQDAGDAIDGNARAMARVLQRLESLRVGSEDIQTIQYSVSPRYQRRENAAPGIVGFTVTNLLAVRVRDLESLGSVLDAVARDGANRFDGLSFGLTDLQELEDEARRDAVADAQRKAKIYAKEAGVGLGDLLAIAELDASPPPIPMGRMEMAMSVASDAVPVAEGELAITRRVSLTYALDNPD